MRSWSRVGWTRWCAAIVLALLAFSMIHAAVPHHAARDCFACKALDTQGVAQVAGALERPADIPSQIAAASPDGPLSADTRYLRPLRAPPVPPVV